jgi:hypothetical protein
LAFHTLWTNSSLPCSSYVGEFDEKEKRQVPSILSCIALRLVAQIWSFFTISLAISGQLNTTDFINKYIYIRTICVCRWHNNMSIKIECGSLCMQGEQNGRKITVLPPAGMAV